MEDDAPSGHQLRSCRCWEPPHGACPAHGIQGPFWGSSRLEATSYYNCICRFVTFCKFMRFGTVPNKTSERICHPRHRIEAKGSHLNKGQCTSRTLWEMMFWRHNRSNEMLARIMKASPLWSAPILAQATLWSPSEPEGSELKEQSTTDKQPKTR